MYGTRATDRRYCIELDKKNGKGCIREAKTHRTARFVSCIVPNVVLSTQCVRTIAYKVTCEPSQTLIEQWYVWIMVKRRLTRKKKRSCKPLSMPLPFVSCPECNRGDAYDIPLSPSLSQSFSLFTHSHCEQMNFVSRRLSRRLCRLRFHFRPDVTISVLRHVKG